MNCPKCQQVGLSPSTVGAVEVDRCERCGGVWCDQTELPQLLALHASDLKTVRAGQLDPAVDARAGLCPRDGTRLLRVSSARRRQVTIESCPTCRGIWLDGGELAQLLSS